MQTAPQPQPWKSTVAGVLSLVVGGVAALAFFGIIISIIIFTNAPNLVPNLEDQIYPMTVGALADILAVVSVFVAAEAVLAILGGIANLERKRWGLALAGSIAAIFGPWWPLGVTATIFTALARYEFR